MKLLHQLNEENKSTDLVNAITKRIEREYPKAFSEYGAEYVAEIIHDVANRSKNMERNTASDSGTLADIVIGTIKKQLKGKE